MVDGPCQRNMDVESDGGQECHEASGGVQRDECLTLVQMCGIGEKDRRTEDTGGSDPEFWDLEEVGDMIECTRAGTSRVDEDEVEVVEGSSVASGLTGGQTCGDVWEEENEWLLNECQAHSGVVEPVSGYTLSLNPHAEEFHPRPRIPMKYGLEVQSSIQLHALVKLSGLPNFKGCRVPVRTAINMAAVRDLAKGFHDQEAIDFLEFGFPISFQGVIHQTVPPGNHKGAREFPEAIEEYIRRECELGATLRPFDRNPLGDSPDSSVTAELCAEIGDIREKDNLGFVLSSRQGGQRWH